MTRNTIIVTFNSVDILEYIISFQYYDDPSIDNTLVSFNETIKSLRTLPNEVTQGVDVNDQAVKFAEAVTIDYPILTASVSGNTVIITTNNSSPIINRPPNSEKIEYYVKTGSTFINRFDVLTNNLNGYETKFDIVNSDPINYTDILMKFTTLPIADYDILLGANETETAANMATMFKGYIPQVAPFASNYLTVTNTGTTTDIAIDYLQKVKVTFVFSGIPAEGTTITIDVKRNFETVALVSRTASSTINDETHFRNGSTIAETIQNIITNIREFTEFTNVEFLSLDSNKLVAIITGVIDDIWSIDSVINTTGVITIDTLEDIEESDVISLIEISPTAVLADALVIKVRGSELLIATETQPFDVTGFKIYSWSGNFNFPPADPYVEIQKVKVIPFQENIYLNIAPYLRRQLKGDIALFLQSPNQNRAYFLGTSEAVWVRVDTENILGEVNVGFHQQMYLATDGYTDVLDYHTNQIGPILITGTQRYVERNSVQAIYFKVLPIDAIYYKTSVNPSNTLITYTEDANLSNGYIMGLSVKTDIPGADWIEYTFFEGFQEYHIRFNLYEACDKEYQLVFKNRYGYLEGFPVTGNVKKTVRSEGARYLRNIVDINGNFTINDHNKKEYNVTGNDILTLNTDFLPEYMNAPLKELQLTEELWIVDTLGNALPVIKVNDSMSFKTVKDERLIQYTIQVELAHETIKNIM